MDWLTFISSILVALVWPSVVIIAIAIFRSDISSLMKRAKSVEIAGTKSEFVDYAAAFGYVESQMSKLAAEQNQEDREKLAEEIKNTSKKLAGIHPLALAFLAEIGRGVGSDSAWLEYGQHIISLRRKGFIKLDPDASSERDIQYKEGDFKNNTTASLTPTGDEFLAKLGYTDRRTYSGNKQNA